MEDVPSILTDEDIQNVYDQLSEDDRVILRYLMMELEDNFKKRWNEGNHKIGTKFGPKQTLELICKLSIFLFKFYGPDHEFWNLENKFVNIGG